MSENEPDRLAKVLRMLREECDLSRTEFAQAVGVHPRTVSRWEAGTSEPRGEDVRSRIYALSQDTSHEAELRAMLFGKTDPAALSPLTKVLPYLAGGLVGGPVIAKLMSSAFAGSAAPKSNVREKSKKRVVAAVAQEVAAELDVSLKELGIALQEVILAAQATGLSVAELVELCGEWDSGESSD